MAPSQDGYTSPPGIRSSVPVTSVPEEHEVKGEAALMS